MTTTFWCEYDQECAHSFDCGCTMFNNNPKPTCKECKGTGKVVTVEGLNSLSVTGNNAFFLMVEILGYEDYDLCGEISGEKLLRLIKEAKLVVQPEKIPGNWLLRLEILASIAIRHGSKVKWG